MKLAFLVYHDILDDRVLRVMKSCNIDSYTKWEDVTGKFHGIDPLLGTREYPGKEIVKMIPLQDESEMDPLLKKIEEFNSKAVKPIDKIRVFVLPLERVI